MKIINLLLVGMALITACSPKEKPNNAASDLRFAQYNIEGKRLYEKNCANCHQSNGEGLGRLYPPLAKSDFLTDTAQVACIIKNGLQGPMRVNGIEYNLAMPGNATLTDLEIAEIMTYIYNEWSETKKRLISTHTVSTALKNCH